MDLSLLQKHQKTFVPHVPLVLLQESPSNSGALKESVVGHIDNSDLSFMSHNTEDYRRGTNGTNAQHSLVPSTLLKKPLYSKVLGSKGQKGQAGQAKNAYLEKEYFELKNLINLTGKYLGVSEEEALEMLADTLEYHSIGSALTTFRNLANQLQLKLPKPTNETYMPMPSVKCGECCHFERDSVNPSSGIGNCPANALKLHDKPCYPFTNRTCDKFKSISIQE